MSYPMQLAPSPSLPLYEVLTGVNVTLLEEGVFYIDFLHILRPAVGNICNMWWSVFDLAAAGKTKFGMRSTESSDQKWKVWG